MMASEVRRDGEIEVTTGDMRRVVIHGDELLAEEIVHWWDNFKRLFKDLPVCPFCELPVVVEYEAVMEDPASKGVAHEHCVEDWQIEAQRELQFMEQYDLPLPGSSDEPHPDFEERFEEPEID